MKQEQDVNQCNSSNLFLKKMNLATFLSQSPLDVYLILNIKLYESIFRLSVVQNELNMKQLTMILFLII